MDVSSLCEVYEDKQWKYENKLYRLIARIEALRNKAEELREKADAKESAADELAEKLKRLRKVDWVEYVAKPLAEELRKLTGKKLWTVLDAGSIYPRAYIILHDKDVDKALAECEEQSCLKIVLHPKFEEGFGLRHMSLFYETGAYANEHDYRDAVLAPLPDSIEDVAKLLKPVEMMIP